MKTKKLRGHSTDDEDEQEDNVVELRPRKSDRADKFAPTGKKARKGEHEEVRDAVDKKKAKQAEKLASEIETVAAEFAEKYGKIKKMYGPEAEDFQQDKAAIALTRTLLTDTLEMIPIAKAIYKTYKSERAAYALNALVNQARELQNDIRNLQSLEQQVDYLKETVVQPAMGSIVQNLNAEMFDLNRKFALVCGKASVRKELRHLLDNMFRNFAAHLQENKNSMNNKIEKYFLESE
jgi:hypothetical protein